MRVLRDAAGMHPTCGYMLSSYAQTRRKAPVFCAELP
jgi:hypothetical protein